MFGVQQSVFYRFTAPEDGVANIDTIGSTFDTVLSVFDGCGTIALPDNWIQPTQLACSNDIGGLLGEASFIGDLAMQAGHTYTIKVASTDEASPQSMLDFNFTFTSTTCPGDVAPAGGNDIVNVDDLLAVINAWGPCDDPYICPGDIAPAGGDGAVNVDDLLAVINAWGACP